MTTGFTPNALKTDLYELTMAAGYFQNQVDLRAVFELSCHTMPENRSYLVSCGLAQAVEYLLNLRFTDDDIHYLKSLPVFQSVRPEFFDYLRNFHFTGDVWAIPEGEIFFAKEPMIQVDAPIIEAQIVETFLLSAMNIESLVATKASRIVQAACSDGLKRSVVDFGSRRAHGPDAGVLTARASYIAGCAGTSNVFAGRKFGIANFGTMAHSWVEAFENEPEAFAQYARVFPSNAIVLIDTYDVKKAAAGLKFLKGKIRGVRLDSGDLELLSKQVRKILDKNNMKEVQIIASGNLNEFKISRLVKAKAPIDSYGVGTDMVISRDWPVLDLTYKLVQTKDKAGRVQYKAKRSFAKETIPGRKQVFRHFDKKGLLEKDVIGLFDEKQPKGSECLLKPVIQSGRLVNSLPGLEDSRKYLAQRLETLPKKLMDLNKASPFKIELTKSIAHLKVNNIKKQRNNEARKQRVGSKSIRSKKDYALNTLLLFLYLCATFIQYCPVTLQQAKFI